MNPKAKWGMIGGGIGLFVIIGLAGGWDEDKSETTAKPEPTVTVTEKPEPKPEPTPEPTPEVDPVLLSKDMTEAAFKLTWSTTDEANKDLMCTSIDLFGKDWAKENMQTGGNEVDGTDLDWDLMVDLMEKKCKAEDRY